MKIEFIENIIIGCGPAGLQLGYYFMKEGIEYMILERAESAGSFFEKFPHSGELISINKLYTGSDNKEFNLRHDWNSLLNDFVLNFGEYTEEYYPKREDLHRYLCDFSEYYKIKVSYKKNVIKIKKVNDKFYILCNDNSIYSCKKLIIATGLTKQNIPNIGNIEKYGRHYGEYEKDYFKNNLKKYKNKNVLIIGNGNSGFELGNMLNKVCGSILILGKNSLPKPAYVTHYTGSVRSKYMGFYDTFLLKSLNAYDFLNTNTNKNVSIIKKDDNRYYIVQYENNSNEYYSHYSEPDIGFDEVINCTGWVFDDSIFDMEIKRSDKYPLLDSKYESNVSNLYFIGALMHWRDYKKSSGGFIHGFRYLIDNFVKMNYTRYDPLIIKLDKIVDYIICRINISSGLYQMHGELVDIFYRENNVYKYYEQVSLLYMLNKLETTSNIYVISLEYDYDKKEYDVRKIGERTSRMGKESNARLIHPILRVYEKDELIDVYHLDEDLFARFKNEVKYGYKLERLLNIMSNV